ncbi:MAG TPA: DUF969 domain-containing protein [Opitutaceae bacterium]|nr:DUF969 domain-containing protein [Opitutaceae bacterium]
MIKLIGVLVVAAGFALRFNTLLVVMAAGIATGLCAGLSFHEIMTQFGRFFVENRYLTLPVVLIVPVIGLLERYGLQEHAERFIRGARAVTAGRVLLLYTAVRQVSIALGVNVGGHAGAVRPLIAPMAEGAARARHGDLPEEMVQTVRAHAAAAENVGNFFGEDIFIAVGAVLLMKGFFEAVGLAVDVWSMALWGIPTALAAFGAMWWRCRRLDRSLARVAAKTTGAERRGGP